jgi:hypothetical protein
MPLNVINLINFSYLLGLIKKYKDNVIPVQAVEALRVARG